MNINGNRAVFFKRQNMVFAIVAEVFDLFFVKTKYFDK